LLSIILYLSKAQLRLSRRVRCLIIWFSLALRSIFMLYFMLHLVMNQLRAYTPGRAYPGLDNNIFSTGVEREFFYVYHYPQPA
jgi:hypothetical protein